jgi:anaerobic magnesium-protoporphyrin IX monomethyl ester cyclase
MRVTLINVSARLSSDGSRLISALLKRANHQVKTVFLARPEPLLYESGEIELLDGILKETDLVLIAVYSSYAVRAVQITQFIHKKYPGMLVIWGGPHCISAPELSLPHADGVCFSEGDIAVVDLVGRIAGGHNYSDTPNMAFRVNGTEKVNSILPPFLDLDSLPFYDYEMDDHFLLDRGLFQMSKEILRQRLAGYPYYIPILYVLTSRGCPHRCSYCNNSRYLNMFTRNPVRLQSVDRTINELAHTLQTLDFVRFIGFGDDDFFVRPKDDIEEFARKYKEKIGLPFGIAISANTYSREKVEILSGCGLRAIQMGVQSASQRILDEVYHRKIKVSKTISVVREISTYHESHGFDFLLDFIIDNPYETPDDIIQTYLYLLDLPPDVRINIFFLAFFPGTPLYERALEDGIIQPYSERSFRFYTRSRVTYQKNYETFLVLLARYIRRKPWWQKHLPLIVLRGLASPSVRKVGAILPKSLFASMSKFVQ